MSTIFAPLTLKGLCSVYVLRISGNKRLECLQNLGIKKEGIPQKSTVLNIKTTNGD